ncbi:MAG: ComF family protein [Bacteroidales bacterium]|nr:ComF family protein [Bacteroidales bacterium]
MPALFGRLLDLIFPPLCPVCGDLLTAGEPCLCAACRYALPRTRFEDFRCNKAVDRLAGKVRFDRAYAFFHYTKESSVQCLIERFKYQGEGRLASYLGQLAGRDLSMRRFFEGMDLLVPVPLHPSRQRQRGYNQSELIAGGLSLQAGLPVSAEALCRLVRTETQTRKGLWERQVNTQGVFEAPRPELIQGKHVLLVDDVLTTGATMQACAEALWRAGCGQLSFFALALA